MSDIQVIFPRVGDPIILNDAEVLSSGVHITWCFTTDNDKIKSVEVKFSDPLATFFEGKQTDPWGNSNPCEYREAVSNWRADFYGHVPDYSNAKRPVIAKYTVRGLTQSGRTVKGTLIDPIIITPKP